MSKRDKDNAQDRAPGFIPPACAYGGPLQGGPALNRLKDRLKEKLSGKREPSAPGTPRSD